jgi:ATP-dependent Lhr-like helicase
VTGFDRLHPALQHHVVNTLGWRTLRPLQEATIDPVLDGANVVAVAPTAAGKTEAAVLPLLSAMLERDHTGLSVLYVCPLRALLNNLHVRIGDYARMVGRTAGLWHGDVRGGARDRILDEPPDVLLTTPESLEVMLISRKVEHERLFADVHAVVVDEIHAFGGDDRGWHLLAVLERISRVAGRDIQRIGLSATVGEPATLLRWLCGSSTRPSLVVAPDGGAPAAPELTLDHVGSLRNAAQVISQLHRGEKRLVFCDSRARVEQLAVELRARDVDTFVSHSSLALDERRRAEEAFAQARDCVIVATSTLELGIDVGDLDRVIQIDTPSTVAAFLQRLGRAGRRAGTTRNMLFLTTKPESVALTAAGLLQLWSTGYVEPVVPPPAPWHLLAQQLLALVLQRDGVGRNLWADELRALPEFAAAIDAGIGERVVAHLVDTGMLFEDEGILSIGPAGERSYGYRHFMELTSAFTSDPLFVARHGATEIGFLHPLSLLTPDRHFATVLLAGRAWDIVGIDWDRHTVALVPSDQAGSSKWMGEGLPLSIELCHAVRAVLAGTDPGGVTLSKRAVAVLGELRGEAPWTTPGTTTLVRQGGKARWWTFAGLRANAALGPCLGSLRTTTAMDNLWIEVDPATTVEQLNRRLSEVDVATLPPSPLAAQAADELKFADCLPGDLALAIADVRLGDPDAVRSCLAEPRNAWNTEA